MDIPLVPPRLPSGHADASALLGDEATPAVVVPSAKPKPEPSGLRPIGLVDAEAARTGRSKCAHCRVPSLDGKMRFYWCYNRSKPSVWLHPNCIDHIDNTTLSVSVDALQKVVDTRILHLRHVHDRGVEG